MTKTHQAPTPEDGQEHSPCGSLGVTGSGGRFSPATAGAGGSFLVSYLVLIVSGLRGWEWRETEIKRLEASGWVVSSEPSPMYGSILMEKRG